LIPDTSISRTSAPGKRRTDPLLDVLGGVLADQHAVVAADVVHDRLVELVAADPHRTCIDHAAERDDTDFGRPATDVDDHRPGRLGDRQAGADRCCHRLLDQEDLARTGADRRLADGPPLDLRRARRHADDDPW
jgi:hypothetical protein